MKAVNQLGIWMDHSNAHMIEFSEDKVKTTTIESKFSDQEKAPGLEKGENIMHNKEQHLQSSYYKVLGDTIRKYDEVLLFGPTNAKTELLRTLNSDRHFDEIKFDVKQSDSMTKNQEHAFVRDYFSKN